MLYIVLLLVRAPFYVYLVFVLYFVFWLFWLSCQYLLSDRLERLTMVRGSSPECPGWRVLIIFLVYCIVSFHCFIMCVCCLPSIRDIVPTTMAWYSLFVLNVLLNTKQTNKPSTWIPVWLQYCGRWAACCLGYVLSQWVNDDDIVRNWYLLDFAIAQYMIVMFLLFLVQFAVACACLALSNSQQHRLYSSGWQSASYKLRERAQNLFGCCGYNTTTQDDVMSPTDKGGFDHPSCADVICF